LTPLIHSDAYKKLPDEQKQFYLSKALEDLRSIAKGAAEAKDPYLFAELQLKKIPKRERAFRESLGQDISGTIERVRQLRTDWQAQQRK
jgi:hypothetical protein